MTITGWRKAARSSSYNGCVEAGSWRTSSYSESGNCIEAGSWRTSSFSMSNGDRLSAGTCAHGVAVRDSKLGASSPVLSFRAEEWSRFAVRVKRGEAVTDG